MQRDALSLLEGLLADVLLSKSSNFTKGGLDEFLKLQDTFQYNSTRSPFFVFSPLTYPHHSRYKVTLVAGVQMRDSQTLVSEVQSLCVRLRLKNYT